MDKRGRYLVVTVGTTEFEELLRELDTPAFYQLCKDMGFDTVVFQTGRGKHIPAASPIINVETLDFTPDITELFKGADTVVSHCGAGTLLDCLKLNKRVIAVVNNTLMDNHQRELFDKLRDEHYIVGFTSPQEVMKDLNLLRNYLTTQWKQYEKPSHCILNDLIKD